MTTDATPGPATSGRAVNGDCELHFDTFGDPHEPTLLLVNGLGSQCINYPDGWCRLFAAAGFYVVRFDNRDVGWSTSYAGRPVDGDGAAYHLADMAADAVAVLDAVGVERAHVMGLSMGGMIVQALGIDHGDRLRSLTSVMSTTGEDGYGGATPAALAALLAPPPTDRESFIAAHVAGLRIWGSPAFADEFRWRADAERAFERAFEPTGPTRQFLAIRSSPARAARLPAITAPTLVLHGDRDTLIDQSGGRRTAELIPGARFELIEGLGHDYPPQLWPRWVELVAGHAHGAERARR